MLGSVILLAAVLSGTNDADPASNDFAAHVRQLVLALGAPQLAERQTAEEELLKLGPRILDLLPHDAALDKAEMAQRVGRVRRQLQRAQAALGVQPSRVTLRGRMPLESILTAIQQQTGNKISTARLDVSTGLLKRALDVDFDKTPFWSAVDSLRAQTGLEIYGYGERKSVDLVPSADRRPSGREYLCHVGPFRFQVVSLLGRRELRPLETRSLQVELEVAWEPRLAPIDLKQRLADVEAIDDRGNRLSLDTPAASLEVPVPRGPIASRLLVPMALPTREVRAIAQLRGTLSVLLPGPIEEFRFEGLGVGQKTVKRIAGVSVTLEDSSQVGKSLEVRLLVHFDNAGDALASHRTWVFQNPVYLRTGEGKTVPADSMTPTRQTADEIGIAVVFSVDRPSDDYTLVYQTPTMVFTLPVKYEFRDVPLP